MVGAVGLREKLCVKCSRFELHVCEEERGSRADTLLQSLPFPHWAPSLLKISVCFNLLKATTPGATLVMNATTDYVRPRLLAVKEEGTSSEDGQNSLPLPFSSTF